jgi:sulfoxide reductase heme-binding subunit YedZ
MPAWTYANSIKRYQWLLFFVGLFPLARLIYLGYQDELTANPIEFITRSTGTWSLVFLCITLSISPLRKITGITQLIRFRRLLGLLVFFYACLHFLIWFWLDHNLSISEMLQDVFKRPFITMGFISLVLLCPLAITSNQFSIRLLKRHWSTLHKLIYIVSLTVIVHYWWHKSGKQDFTTVGIYAAVILSLLAFRIYFYLAKKHKAPH